MIKRLMKILVFIVLLPLVFVEVPFYTIRWVVTGKEFDYPIFSKVLGW